VPGRASGLLINTQKHNALRNVRSIVINTVDLTSPSSMPVPQIGQVTSLDPNAG